MSGSVYDVGELQRIQNFVDQQQEQFRIGEQDKNKKEWIVLASIVTLSSVLIILVLKKVVK